MRREAAACSLLVTMGMAACGSPSVQAPPPSQVPCQASAIWAGYSDTWLRATDGRYWFVGVGGGGTIPTSWGSTTPMPKPQLESWVPSDARDLNVRSGGFVCVLSTGNTLHCGVGIPDATTKTVDGVAAVAFGPMGDSQDTLLMVDGSVWGFANIAGATTQEVPLGKTAASVAAGEETLCALEEDGSVWCWGSGYLGDGQGAYARSDLQAPKQVPLPMAATAVAAGFDASCAILSDASLWCWGGRQFGAGARSGVAPWVTPQAVDIADVKMVTMGAFQVCALKSDGALWCWGSNFFGEAGYEPVGEAASSTWDVPRQVALLGSDVKSVSAGFQHTCAIENDSTVWCWGNSGAGQVGNQNVTNPAPLLLEGCQ